MMINYSLLMYLRICLALSISLLDCKPHTKLLLNFAMVPYLGKSYLKACTLIRYYPSYLFIIKIPSHYICGKTSSERKVMDCLGCDVLTLCVVVLVGVNFVDTFHWFNVCVLCVSSGCLLHITRIELHNL